MNAHLIFLALSSSLSLLICRYDFHPLPTILTVLWLCYIFIRKKYLLGFASITMMIIFTFTYYFIEERNKTSLQEGEFVVLSNFSSIPTINGDRLSGFIETRQGEKLALTYHIKSKEEKKAIEELIPGTSCEFTGILKPPSQPTVPNAFNYKQYLYDNYVHWIFQADFIKNCRVGKIDFYEFLLIIRKNGIDYIREVYPEASSGIVQALLFGERKGLNKELKTAYEELGIVHLLAISGLHVGFLTWALYYLLLILGITREKASVAMVVLLPIYIILTGASPSVIRACFMTILFLLFKLFKQKVTPLDVISLTFILLLFYNPYYLFHAGFQLSYAVSYGLLLSASILRSVSSWIGKLTMVSVIAQLCSMPFLLFHFYEISFISLPLNIVFVPFYSLIVLPSAVIVSVLSVVLPFIGFPLLTLFNSLLEQSNQLVLLASRIPYTNFTSGKPAPFYLLCLVASIFYLLLQYENRKKLLKPLLLGTTMLFLLHLIPYLNPTGRVLVIDVGQGESIFIQLPYNKGNYLIDTGGLLRFPKKKWQESSETYSIVDSVTVPYLKSIGVTKLNALFLTHGDLDHIGETSILLDKVKVKQLIIPAGFVRGKLEEKILLKAKKMNIPFEIVKSGHRFHLNGISLFVVSPYIFSDSKNNDSMVLWAKIGRLRWIFTGDLEEGGEEVMIQRYPNLRTDVLKVGHHGSKDSTSDKLLDHLKPQLAIISAGRKNRYKHPHKEVLNKLSDRRITVLRTDLNGSILYEFNSNTGTFSHFPPYDTVK